MFCFYYLDFNVQVEQIGISDPKKSFSLCNVTISSGAITKLITERLGNRMFSRCLPSSSLRSSLSQVLFLSLAIYSLLQEFPGIDYLRSELTPAYLPASHVRKTRAFDRPSAHSRHSYSLITRLFQTRNPLDYVCEALFKIRFIVTKYTATVLQENSAPRIASCCAHSVICKDKVSRYVGTCISFYVVGP